MPNSRVLGVHLVPWDVVELFFGQTCLHYTSSTQSYFTLTSNYFSGIFSGYTLGVQLVPWDVVKIFFVLNCLHLL